MGVFVRACVRACMYACVPCALFQQTESFSAGVVMAIVVGRAGTGLAVAGFITGLRAVGMGPALGMFL